MLILHITVIFTSNENIVWTTNFCTFLNFVLIKHFQFDQDFSTIIQNHHSSSKYTDKVRYHKSNKKCFMKTKWILYSDSESVPLVRDIAWVWSKFIALVAFLFVKLLTLTHLFSLFSSSIFSHLHLFILSNQLI